MSGTHADTTHVSGADDDTATGAVRSRERATAAYILAITVGAMGGVG